MLARRPVLANSCAAATTAVEARYRIDVPIVDERQISVVALDEEAGAIIRRLAADHPKRVQWLQARPETSAPGATGHPGWLAGRPNGATGEANRSARRPNGAAGQDGSPAGRSDGGAGATGSSSTSVWDLRGQPLSLERSIHRADLVVMVATSDEAAATVPVVGRACDGDAVMTAGIVIGDRARTRSVVAALRPHTRMLLCSQDEQDVSDILQALRA